MRSVTGAVLALVVFAQAGFAQNEAALRAAFEGRTVTVKLDMPATSKGIDVFPQEPMAVDFRDVAQRLKDNGTALRIGQQAMITKVLIKKNSHIEFQLGGGGYGTFGDWMSSPSEVSVVHAGETAEEKALREEIKHTTDKAKKKELERKLNGLRSERERENARASADATQANQAVEATMRARRVESGSRFNIRYRHGIPSDALTPEGVMRALAAFVDFSGVPGAPAVIAAPTDTPQITESNGNGHVNGNGNGNGTTEASGLASLRKGLTLKEVEQLLGPALTATEVQDGSMFVMKRTYAVDGMKVAAQFVAGVLIDFTITPQ